MRIGFDNQLYIEKQSEKIYERINAFGKLYLEFGGKLFDDLHASRILPGFQPDAKTSILKKMKDQLEVIICISAPDIERKKLRADYGITYDLEVFRYIDKIREMKILISSVIITQYENQPSADVFKTKLQNRGVNVYLHRKTAGYPTQVELIVSEEGYGQNPYIETTKPLVVVTAPGPGSGKLGTCLSQLYHENKRGIKAGYSKFETFPVWNLPLNHPVNQAYEAATADLLDVNMIDSFHLDAYGEYSVNYNRDIEVFPVVKRILEKITQEECKYKSPTDMGVNMLGYFITDENIVKEASKQEIIRRYYLALCSLKQGTGSEKTVEKLELMLNGLFLTKNDRPVAVEARRKADATGKRVLAIELPNGEIITGKSQELFSHCSACLINTIKVLSNITDSIKLLPKVVIDPIHHLKKDLLHQSQTMLSVQETLLALAISAVTNPTVDLANSKLKMLSGLEAHSTVMLPKTEENSLKMLGIRVTCDDQFYGEELFED